MFSSLSFPLLVQFFKFKMGHMRLFILLSTLFIIGAFTDYKVDSGIEQPVGSPKGNIIYCAPSFDATDLNAKAPLLEGLGALNYSITTRSAQAQKYFNQGLALTYGFNHGEAARSFKTAIALDSTCAMAYWGLALVLGPNYNAALNPTSLTDINQAIDNAVKNSHLVKPNEKALIHAMSKRFPRVEVKDITPFYEAYAREMKSAHQQFPGDVEIAILYADALMNLHPWNLWLKDGTPQPWTPEIIRHLENTLRQAPTHPGAIHYYIHATEASKEARKALPYADKLRGAMPAAGHLVHMPSHTYIRTGAYHEGVIVNEAAASADSSYISQCKVQGAYPMLYYPHNIHFLAACAFLEGNSKKAIDAAWKVSANADRKYLHESATVQHFLIIPYYTLVHLGRWEDILSLAKPGELKYPVAIWHYARGMAFRAQDNIKAAEKELEAIRQIAADESLKSFMIWDLNSAQDLVNIAALVLEGEIFGYKKQYNQSVSALVKATEIEDRLNYNEPPDWFFSVRLTLGHVLVQAGRYQEAEKVYRKDLETFPNNGWALRGLFNSLSGQGKKAEADKVYEEFKKAWKWADINIASSRVY
jgi:tetratricopeptide (TPR) repeat protein